MALTIFGMFFLTGATLSVRFKVLILFPAIGLAVVSATAVGIGRGDHVGGVLLTIALVAATLQIGYLFGLIARAVIAGSVCPNARRVMVQKLGHQ